MQRLNRTYKFYLTKLLSIFAKTDNSSESESYQMNNKATESVENCIICNKQQSDVVFDCGHISTCEQCTFVDNTCRVCNEPTKERLIVKYDENIKGVILDILEKPDAKQ